LLAAPDVAHGQLPPPPPKDAPKPADKTDDLPAGALRKMINPNSPDSHREGASIVAFAPDGKLVASGGGEHLARLWDPATGKLVRQCEPHGGWVCYLAFAPDGKTLATAGYGGKE